nr:pentatricopeptide repeat-containing protein At4g13650 [Ipomoea batatas]GME15343.1 pentatricopeptide repeat-containing protein At4g13650 [Ipomoea batatas]
MLNRIIDGFIHSLLKSSANCLKETLHSTCLKSIRLVKLAPFTSSASAISPVLDDFPYEESEGNNSRSSVPCVRKDNGFSNQRYWLSSLDSYTRSGSISEAKELQGKILKTDETIGTSLINSYVGNEDLAGSLQVLNDTPSRSKNVSEWNKLISGFQNDVRIFHMFSRMMNENVRPDGSTFATVLGACGGAEIASHFHVIEQIHAMIVHYGFAGSCSVCNYLIDLYSKNGSVDSAKKVFEDLHSRDSASWVAMMTGFCQNGREKDAIFLYKDMRKSGVIPTPYAFSSVLSATTKLLLLELGEQFHSIILKWGYLSDVYVGNALVALYSRCGALLSAEQIFSEMKLRDRVSYNTLISGFSVQGFSERALKLFDKMQIDSIKSDCVTIASLLNACASSGDLQKGRQLHSYATKAGLCSDIIIEGSILDLYVKCSDIKTARDFFLTTQMENIVLWNVMLVAYGQKGDLNESCRLFAQMQSEGLQPNQYTYPSILRTCTSVGDLDLGEQIHSQVIKTGFQPNVYVCSVLIDMYAKHGKLDAAQKIFRRLNEEDVVYWTSMIAGYTQHDLFVEAIRLFHQMQDHHIQSDNIGFASAITACAGIQALNQGRQVHAQSIIFGYASDLSIGNALVCLYARCGKVHDAYVAFNKIDSKDNISWNGLVSGFAQSGYCEEALRVFSRMNHSGVEANMYTYGSAVSAAANTTNIKQGKQIHARMIKTGYDSETEASNVLITMYAKCGNLSDARREFLEMPCRNQVSWNAMITGYSQHGLGNEALELFEEMKNAGVIPNYVTYVGVLSACSHVRLVDEGLSYFKSMSEDHDLVPRPEHYACVVDILGRAGQLQCAREFVETMPIAPDAMVWRTLLSACTVHKNIEIGEFAGNHLLELEPKDSATYVLLSNLYAVVGRWNHRNCTRQLMKDMGVRKEPGRSWIEVKNKIHAFFVGDRLHPLADEIHTFVEELNKRAAAVGYIQDCHNLWNDLELEQKDATAFVHSEKLAIAFGLLNLPDTIPLCVMKNLRVCNDCHNWIKCVSKVANRAIVVRDAYRFHHFEDGECSCQNFW